MSDSSEEEFEGFSEQEIINAGRRYQELLDRNGIGNDNEIDIESEDSEPENSDDDETPNINNAGDASQNDGWHDNFDYYERGFPHLFNPRNRTGAQNIQTPDKEPVDFFELFLTHDVLQFIIDCTDAYANKQIRENPNSNRSAWSCPTMPEMKAFLGLTFLMGIIVKPDVKSYWTADCLEVPYFAKVLSRDRFQQIMRYLCFRDPNVHVPAVGERDYDSLYKVRFVIDAFNRQMKEQYVPRRQVAVDESIIPFKGRVSFKQYNPNKPSKWGIKMWAIAESETGYMSYSEIYSGKQDQPAQGLGSRVVKSCIKGADIQNQGYHVYMDNFFTSPVLFDELFDELGTGACGTVRMNRRGLPKEIMKKKPVGINDRGDHLFRQKGSISATVWKDKKVVSCISTIHDNSTTTVNRLSQENGQFVRKEIQCPQMVSDYTKYMGAVDKCDQYIQYYVFNHKTLKWPKRVFFKLLEILKFNAFVLFIASPHHQPGPNTSPMTFLQFSKKVATGLVAGYTGNLSRGRPSLLPAEIRLSHRHMPSEFEKKSWCHVCWARVARGTQEKRSQTKFGCRDCSKHLCMPKCFTRYHTVRDYIA